MTPSRIFVSLALLITCSVSAHAQDGCARLSWGTCDPWNWNADFSGPGVYTLVESMYGVSAPNIGTDTEISIQADSPHVPDAWRFDDAGCQGGSRLLVSSDAWAPDCPGMRGANASFTSQYTYDETNYPVERLRFVSTYDAFVPVPTTRYTVWQIRFDHSRSIVGPTLPDNSRCGGIEYCELLLFDFANVLMPDGQSVSLPGCDPYTRYCGNASWNEGCSPDGVGALLCGDFVRTQPSTWGRVKSLYR